MADEAAFLDAIIADPDDDALRLIFADWLDEQGDPRGEFIRVQIELAGMSEDDPRLAPLAERERELLRLHKTAWLGPVGRIADEAGFRRGLLGSIRVSALAFLEKARVLFNRRPIRKLGIYDISERASDIAASPWLGRL